MTHETHVESYKHRAGTTYFRPVCTCGWRTRGVTRTREIAEQQAAAHVELETKNA